MPDNRGQNSNLNLILVIALVVAAGLAGYFYSQAKQVGKGTQPTTPTPTKQTVKVDNPKFMACLESGKYKDKVKNQANIAMKANIASTPTTVVVDTKTNRRFAIVGAQPYETVKANLDKFMAGEEITLDQPPGRPALKLNDIPAPSNQEDHWRGSTDARYVMIEYSDLECPFCRRFHATAQQVLDDYSDQVAWVYRHLPLTSIHPRAQLEAEASECAAELGGREAFWTFVDAVFDRTKSNGLSFDKDDLAALAAELGIK